MRLGSVISAALVAALLFAPAHSQLFPPFGGGGGGGGGGGAPTGPAGGDLSGTYPNPTVVASHSGSLMFTNTPATITANTGLASDGVTPNPFMIDGALDVTGPATIDGMTAVGSAITVAGTVTVEPAGGPTNNSLLVLGGGTAANPVSITAASTRDSSSIRVAPKGPGVIEITNASAGSGTNSVNGGIVQFVPATVSELLDGTTFTCATTADLGKIGTVSDGDTLTGAAFDAPVVTPTTGPAFRIVACLEEDGATIAWVYH